MGADWRVKVRRGPKVEKESFDALGGALEFVEAHGHDLERTAGTGTVELPLGRSFEPVQQVVGRIEIAGPRRVRAGIDVRGDGSVEAWTGRLRREVLELRPGETAYEALRRVL